MIRPTASRKAREILSIMSLAALTLTLAALAGRAYQLTSCPEIDCTMAQECQGCWYERGTE